MFFGNIMGERQLPIFITTPFIGQGDILNEEWIDGRIALFEAVTKNSLLNLITKDVHWLVFLGSNPTSKVLEYAYSTLGGFENVHLLKSKWEDENINEKAIEMSPVNHYITTLIADDDAWPKDYISTIRNSANSLLDDGHQHAGLTYSNGLEWVMSDQVDINFLQKSGFKILRKKNLVEFNCPWLGCGFFVLQTKDRPFNSLTAAHLTMSKKLKEEGFSAHVSDTPTRAWLYNRHQLSASSLVHSESEPLDFSLDELESEFAIDAEKVAAWPSSRFSAYYSEKAQEVGMLDMYEFPDLEHFVHMPFKSFFLNNGYLVIDPFTHFNIQGESRLRIYNAATKKYTLLFNMNIQGARKLRFHKSMFDLSQEYKFDVQKLVEGSWTRVMPYVLIKFKELDYPSTIEIESESIFKAQAQLETNSNHRVDIATKTSHFKLELPTGSLRECIFDQSILEDSTPTNFKRFIMQNDNWELIDRGTLQ
jgi:hypothetical protein|tara:strand:+ start:487 stop:1920 length:1434 start_codon:yes stop_codon:yes gene_type:complete